jgi:hypothetical protein
MIKSKRSLFCKKAPQKTVILGPGAFSTAEDFGVEVFCGAGAAMIERSEV